MTCRYGLFFIVLVVTLTSCTRVDPVLDIPVEVAEIEMYPRADRDGLLPLRWPVQHIEPHEDFTIVITPGTTISSINEIVIRFINSTDSDITLNRSRYPQVKIDGYWVFVIPRFWVSDWPMRLPTIIHPNSHKDIYHADRWYHSGGGLPASDQFGPLPPGVYRLVYFAEPDIGNVGATFVIEEATYSRHQDSPGYSPLKMTLVTRPRVCLKT